MSELKSYAVWDASTRWFHWIMRSVSSPSRLWAS